MTTAVHPLRQIKFHLKSTSDLTTLLLVFMADESRGQAPAEKIDAYRRQNGGVESTTSTVLLFGALN